MFFVFANILKKQNSKGKVHRLKVNNFKQILHNKMKLNRDMRNIFQVQFYKD